MEYLINYIYIGGKQTLFTVLLPFFVSPCMSLIMVGGNDLLLSMNFTQCNTIHFFHISSFTMGAPQRILADRTFEQYSTFTASVKTTPSYAPPSSFGH